MRVTWGGVADRRDRMMVVGARMGRIGKNIKMFRDQANMTQDELATRVNLAGGAQIAQFEAGTKAPSLEKAMDIATQVGVSLSQLVGEHPPPGSAPGHVTNHIHGDNQTVYQHVEHATLLSEEMEQRLTALLREHLDTHRAELLRLFDVAALRQAIQEAVRDGMRDALRRTDGTPPRRPEEVSRRVRQEG